MYVQYSVKRGRATLRVGYENNITPHLRLGPYKGSVNSVKYRSTLLDAPSSLRAAHKLTLHVDWLVPTYVDHFMTRYMCICYVLKVFY